MNVDISGVFKPGDPPPLGYNDWQEWAMVQSYAGLRQKRCGLCSLWKFPQELSSKSVTLTGTAGRTGWITSPICKDCAAKPKKGTE